MNKGRDNTPKYCCDCGAEMFTKKTKKDYYCDENANSKECKLQYVVLCKNCIVECNNCKSTFCKDCWVAKDKYEFSCKTHSHCKGCKTKSSPCFIDDSGCGCGCGYFEPSKIIWRSYKDKDTYIKEIWGPFIKGLELQTQHLRAPRGKC